MEVITISSEAYHAMIMELAALISEKMNQEQDIWVGKEEAKALLGISSDTTLGKLKSEGLIRYSEVGPRTHLYDSSSIREYIDNQAKP